MLSSIYFLSSSVMVGWAAGLSYETRNQKQYQMIPKDPAGGGKGDRRVQEEKSKKYLLKKQKRKAVKETLNAAAVIVVKGVSP